ncbi:EAL domain-containing response regulator [Endozoicomonas acroporae]|uniref:EAL domain-containing response regulator n=1 Tax=Endozoicomonas acroporae TaxID=1701104 RepID=UPI0013D5A6DE|nr:EAL domain-containing protein [Endozoicomonas acroporae]
MNYRRQTLRLLALEDSPNDVERWVKLFRNAGLPPRVQHIASIETMEEALSEQPWDVVLSAEETTRLNAQQVLAIIEKHQKDIPVIVTLPEYNPQRTSTWLSAGARDAIPSAHEEHILHAVLRELTSLEDRRNLSNVRQELNESNKRCQLLLANASEAIAYIHDGMHVDANAAYLQLTGYDHADDLAGIPLIDMIAAQHQAEIRQMLKQFGTDQTTDQVECELVHTDGHSTPVSLRLSAAQYDDEPCIQLILLPLMVPVLSQPVNHKASAETEEQFLEQAASAVTAATEATLAWIQLDDFQNLQQEASIDGIISIQGSIVRMAEELFPAAAICHYTDDSFLLVETAGNPDDTHKRLITLQSAIDEHLFGSDDETLTATVSIGFAVKEHKQDITILLNNAESACQRAIKNAKRLCRYSKTEELDEKARDGDVQAMIRQALSQDSFRLLFQPVINITGSEEKQYEVFLRLHSHQGEVVEAGTFMAAAESSSLMPHIDRWVLRQCVRQLAQVHKQGQSVRLLIHLSHLSIQGTELAQYLSGLLKATELPPDSIVLQLPESIVLQQLKRIVDFAEAIHNIGCQLAITRFQGDSRSMKILKHLDIQFVRLDGSFTSKLDENSDENIIKMLDILKEHNIRSIVPKVESTRTLAHLWRMGVDYAQGYYIQGPMEAMDFDFG